MTSIKLAVHIKNLLWKDDISGLNRNNYNEAIRLYNDYFNTKCKNNSSGRLTVQKFCEKTLKEYWDVPISIFSSGYKCYPPKVVPTFHRV